MSLNRQERWNPVGPVEITPEEYERQVRDWLRESKGNPTDIEVGHLEKIAGSGGQYEFDVVARFKRFGGAEFTVLVECKRYRKAVEHELVLTLQAKLLDVKGQKAMMFSTGGFQKGAIEYASEYNIALITLKDGRASYETRNDGPPVEPPPWVDLPRFMGERLSVGEKGIREQRVQHGYVRAISEFLSSL